MSAFIGSIHSPKKEGAPSWNLDSFTCILWILVENRLLDTHSCAITRVLPFAHSTTIAHGQCGSCGSFNRSIHEIWLSQTHRCPSAVLDITSYSMSVSVCKTGLSTVELSLCAAGASSSNHPGIWCNRRKYAWFSSRPKKNKTCILQWRPGPPTCACSYLCENVWVWTATNHNKSTDEEPFILTNPQNICMYLHRSSQHVRSTANSLIMPS